MFQTFSLEPSEFNLFYHSGATEGINTFFKGVAFRKFKEKKAASFFFSAVDHACVVQLKVDLESLGHSVHFFNVNLDGAFNVDELIKNIKEEQSCGREVFLNFTYVNNETGVHWPLTIAESIKEQTNAFIHVDAVQVVGKIRNWRYLSFKLDGYTFSGHKFGALKGIGFSFIKKDLEFSPLLTGGNQQMGIRPGTENGIGVYTLKLALEEIKEKFNPTELSDAKDFIETNLKTLIGDRGVVVGVKAQQRNLNTIFLVLHGQKAEILGAKFDMMGVDLSTGSACSSGIIKENRILMSMGYSFEDSRSSLRFSFSPLMTMADAQLYFEKIQTIFNSILK